MDIFIEVVLGEDEMRWSFEILNFYFFCRSVSFLHPKNNRDSIIKNGAYLNFLTGCFCIYLYNIPFLDFLNDYGKFDITSEYNECQISNLKRWCCFARRRTFFLVPEQVFVGEKHKKKKTL